MLRKLLSALIAPVCVLRVFPEIVDCGFFVHGFVLAAIAVVGTEINQNGESR
ncbi:hypothetical protein D3C79_1098400 [compost metagenome]